MEEDKIKAIYYIKDYRTDEIIYIGQTTDFKQRKYAHFGNTNSAIACYMLNEGRKNFTMLPFEDIDVSNYSREELKNKENELIIKYDTINKGFNKNKSGVYKSKNQYDKLFYSENKEERKLYYREYYKNTKKEYCKKYYKEHREDIIERCKNYQKQKRDKN